MKTPNTQTNDGLDIPAALRRTTNAKGVTLSAGPAVVATGAKTAPKKADAPAAPKPMTKRETAKLEAETKRALRASAKTAKDADAFNKAAILKAVTPAKAPKAAKPPKAPKSTPVTAEPALGPDGQPLVKVSRSIVPMRFKAKYAKNAGTCGDDMALELKAATTTRNADKREVLDTEALWAIALANNIDVAKYRDLNNGQKRMNVGNKLRGKLAAGEDVVVGKRKFRAEDYQPRQ